MGKLLHQLRECIFAVEHIECVRVLTNAVEAVRLQFQGVLKCIGCLLQILMQIQRLGSARQ